jgi:prepilin-type N-terminal cleavage/methylation domain-containing protein/prepilin-type processing-associated H-X9-DG protein
MQRNTSQRNNSSGFTLIELLVVISIIAMLMSILMPAMARVRKQGQAVACQSNLKQWAAIYIMYTDDNNGFFLAGNHHNNHISQWCRALEPYQKDKMLKFCPVATRTIWEKGVKTTGGDSWANLVGTTLQAWGMDTGESGGYTGGSYGENSWATNPPDDKLEGRPKANFWRSPNVKGAPEVPWLMDSMWLDGWPLHTEYPPAIPDRYWTSLMARYCIDRHQGGTNALFLDWSVRKIGCKELWTLKWHRNFDTRSIWTKAGGVAPEDWPNWMRSMKDY